MSKRVVRPGTALVVAVIALAASTATPAYATVTIGQVGDGVTVRGCGGDSDHLQPSVTSGAGYVAPVTGTITSWSHMARSIPTEITMKLFRPVSGSTYAVVGRDGPRPLVTASLNSFPAAVPVRAGDVLGLHVGADSASCAFATPVAESHLFREGDLAAGESGDFPPEDAFTGLRVNMSAVIEPANGFTIGAIDRNRKKGTATVTVDVPNPGQLSLAGGGVKPDAPAAGPGSATLRIAAKGKKKRKLRRKGRATVEPTITYTPTGGDPSSQPLTVKLRRKR
jgi:hypothetical protein